MKLKRPPVQLATGIVLLFRIILVVKALEQEPEMVREPPLVVNVVGDGAVTTGAGGNTSRVHVKVPVEGDSLPARSVWVKVMS